MPLRNSFLILVLLGSATAFAQVDRSPLKQKKELPQFDLLKENESIAVIGEQSVQRDEPESRHIINFSLGEMAANSVTLTSNGSTVHYELGSQAPTAMATFGYYPARFGGYWGLLSSIGYSYREQANAGSANSSIHMIPADVLLSYRFERSTHGWWKPYLGVGPGVNIVIQRGIDELNTSEAKGLLVGVLGVGFNIKRLFDMHSPLDWEVTAQYKRWVDLHPSNADYNGGTITLGLSMLL